MKIARRDMERLIYGDDNAPTRRFTQDSPVLPDVWIEYGRNPDARQELLLTPRFRSTAGEVATYLREQLEETSLDTAAIAYNQTYVAANLTFDELVRFVLPMTEWWQENVLPRKAEADAPPDVPAHPLQHYMDHRELVEKALTEFSNEGDYSAETGRELAEQNLELTPDLLWTMRVAGTIARARQIGERRGRRWWPPPGDARELVGALIALLAEPISRDVGEGKYVWQVNRNRRASTSVTESTLAVKADAARLLFKIRCGHVAWGIIDNGIDARHPAFLDRARVKKDFTDKGEKIPQSRAAEYSRVQATYDFTRMRQLLDLRKLHDLDGITDPKLREILDAAERDEKLREDLEELKRRLKVGRPIDWSILEDFLRIPHDQSYIEPRGDHGTHVAGILGADWEENDPPLQGMCPDIRLYDFRVLDKDGANDEFAVLAALQFVTYLNNQKDYYAVHGVNVSLSIPHEVGNFACGRTPVCDECERLVSSGVVVVAAAGNEGYLSYITSRGAAGGFRVTEGYHTVSITDPGNADKVITVGSTHRFQPHTYGVSYFSSRGPTGDGRLKPDLVAPGEKIDAPVPHDSLGRKDGTSMAAPHVSGAAAMLMARHSEFIGRPDRIKKVLCSTATDLGRERYFQGAGMLDVLRAMQSI